MSATLYQSLYLPELNDYELELYSYQNDFGVRKIMFRFNGQSGNILHIIDVEHAIKIERAMAVSPKYNLILLSALQKSITDGPNLSQPGGRSDD